MRAVSTVTLDTETSRLKTNVGSRKRLKDLTPYPILRMRSWGWPKGLQRLKGWFGVWSGGSHHLIRGWQALAGRLYAPDLPRILGNGAVA